MKNLFKYIGLATIFLFSLYYTEKMSGVVINNSILVSEINDNTQKYDIEAVSAVIKDDYIIPGLNGFKVNVLKSYNNMKHLDSFNSYYLEFDEVIPSISLKNNKDKIIKYGNEAKNSVSILVLDNREVIDYSKEKNIKITRLIDQ